MSATSESIERLIDDQLRSVSDRRVVDHVRSLLIDPVRRLRRWDYGEPNTHFDCWDVLEESERTGIAFCEHGFGPECPWGLVTLRGNEDELSIGMDCEWFPRFLDAYFESAASSHPIWRVFKQDPGQRFPGRPIGSESDWHSTWQEVEKLRELEDGSRYHHFHSIAYS